MIDPQAKTDILFKTNDYQIIPDYNNWIIANNFVDFDIMWVESSNSNPSTISLKDVLATDGYIVPYKGEIFGGEAFTMSKKSSRSVKSFRSNRSSVRSFSKKINNKRIPILSPNIVMEKAEDEMNSEQIDFFMDVLKEQNK
jgi:hypothetical protein